MLKFSEDRWLGNKWASIEIDPVDAIYFLPMLSYLMATYNFPMPSLIWDVDGDSADFKIQNSNAILRIDTWSFSIAFEQDAVRDGVLEALRTLPDDYFEI